MDATKFPEEARGVLAIFRAYGNFKTRSEASVLRSTTMVVRWMCAFGAWISRHQVAIASKWRKVVLSHSTNLAMQRDFAVTVPRGDSFFALGVDADSIESTGERLLLNLPSQPQIGVVQLVLNQATREGVVI